MPKIIHKMKGTRFYRIWVGMKTRCTNKNHTWFKHYGGRGISYDQRWESFINFRDDMYKAYLKHAQEHGETDTTLERIDSNGGYSRENCRWATRLEQSRNARNNRFVTFKGVRMSLQEWSKKTGIAYATLHARLYKYKLPLADAFTKERDYKKRPRKKN